MPGVVAVSVVLAYLAFACSVVASRLVPGVVAGRVLLAITVCLYSGCV